MFRRDLGLKYKRVQRIPYNANTEKSLILRSMFAKELLKLLVQKKKINIIAQIGTRREADLPDVPLLSELATNEDDKKVMQLLSAPVAIGRPVFTTPSVPEDRVKALRAAFNATMKDAAFLAEAKKINLEIDPVSGVEMQKIVAGIVATPKEVSDKLLKIIQTEVQRKPKK